MASVGVDGICKIWDLSVDIPKVIQMKNFNAGELFNCQFYKDSPWVLAIGGSSGEVIVWDTEESEALTSVFEGRQPKIIADDADEGFVTEEEEDSEEERSKKKKKKDKKEKKEKKEKKDKKKKKDK